MSTDPGGLFMCRNIKTLHNFTPPATDEEIRASALQFVRKLSGFTRPSRANEPAFNRAVDQVTQVARGDRKSTRLNSSHLGISYAVFCLKKKKHTAKQSYVELRPRPVSRASV